jgi:hypothetical protein
LNKSPARVAADPETQEQRLARLLDYFRSLPRNVRLQLDRDGISEEDLQALVRALRKPPASQGP